MKKTVATHFAFNVPDQTVEAPLVLLHILLIAYEAASENADSREALKIELQKLGVTSDADGFVNWIGETCGNVRSFIETTLMKKGEDEEAEDLETEEAHA